MEVKQLSTGDILRFSVPELAQLGGEALPDRLEAYFFYDTLTTGDVECQTRFTDGRIESEPTERFES